MDNDVLVLAGSRLQITFDPARAAISDIRGRFDPASGFGTNLLSEAGISWRALTSASMSELGESRFTVVSAQTVGGAIDCVITQYVDDSDEPLATVKWQLALDGDCVRASTAIQFHRSWSATAVSVDISTTQWLLAGLFERGVVQQVRSGNSGFAATDPLSVFYTVGNGTGSLAVIPTHAGNQSILTRDETRGTVGLQLVRFGGAEVEDTWTQSTWAADEQVRAGDLFDASFTLFANDLPFPTHAVDFAQFPTIRDAHTHFAAVYSTLAATLGGYLHAGSAYPTIAMPTRTYWTLHTFFDPDAWSVVGSLAFSGDPYLQREALRIVERALGGITESGQIPHHFDGDDPLYVAISGVAQTGPNLFLTLAALDYVAGTGDTGWLRANWDSGLARAIEWMLDFYDPARKLLCVIGPLWVDVFRREGYTFDTNAMAVYALGRFADAAEYLDRPQLADRYRAIGRDLREGIDALWSEDHFITARGRDWESIHDMVDCESYLAVAFNLVDRTRGAQVLERMDRVPNMHPGGRGTWVSEVYYGPDECYGENTGDSATAMARLWWGDLLARQSAGDSETFVRMYEAVRDDLLKLTWMSERYGEGGGMIRAPGYHEYPGILDKMLREGYYGITITLATVDVSPMIGQQFSFTMGGLSLSHSRESVEIRIPGDAKRTFSIAGLEAGSAYLLDTCTVVLTDETGRLSFQGSAGEHHVLALQR